MLHETPCLDRSLMSFAFNADTLRPSHCTPQPSLPALLRIGHTAEFDAPVLMPLPHATSLWIAPQDQGANGPALTLTREIAEHWALQMLLQAPADQLELFIYDTGLDASLPTLERICAAAKAKGMTQRVHFITDAASLQTQLELWQTDARQRKSHLLQTGYADWVQLLKSDAGQPLRLVLFAQLDELVDTERRLASLAPLVRHGPRLGYWFWFLGAAVPPASTRNDRERADWLDWFAQRLQLYLLRFGVGHHGLNMPEPWREHPAMQVYREFGAIRADGLSADERRSVLANSMAVTKLAEDPRAARDYWQVPIGQFQGQPYLFRVGPKSGTVHTLLAGTAGSGKTSLLNLMITRTCESVRPDEVCFVLIDLKRTVSFGLFADVAFVPRLHLFGEIADFTPVLQALRDLIAESQRRNSLFEAAGPRGVVADIATFNRLARERGTPTLPTVVIIIDEGHKLFAIKDAAQKRETASLIEEVAREGRAFGFTLLLSTQTYSNVDIPSGAMSQFQQRLAFKVDERDLRYILKPDNTAPLTLLKRHLIVNDDFGQPAANRTVKIDDSDPEDIHHRMEAVRERYRGTAPPLIATAPPPAVAAAPAPFVSRFASSPPSSAPPAHQ